jgi:hypothetical protein
MKNDWREALLMITKDFLKNYSQGIQIYFEETLKSSYGIICDLFD